MEIYTDGGCIENPGGIGAWAFVVVVNGQGIYKQSGAELETSNNRMELQAIIEACKYAARFPYHALIQTDSDLCVKCGNGLWKRRANLDLWYAFDAVRQVRHELRWIKGHNGNQWNDLADVMCTREMAELKAWRDDRSIELNASHGGCDASQT